MEQKRASDLQIERQGEPGSESAPSESKDDRIASLEEEVKGLRVGLEKAEERAVKEEERNLYLRAEFDNFRKKMEKEMNEFREVAARNVLERVVEIAENLERLREHASREEDISSIREGVEKVEGFTKSVLRTFGVEEMDPVREGFDPMKHEAVMGSNSSGSGEVRVTRVLQKGYLLHGRVMRPAKVCISVVETDDVEEAAENGSGEEGARQENAQGPEEGPPGEKEDG